MIGVFDSGFGGLTVMKELLKKLPDYNYIYLGDNARAPYGNRSPETVYKYTCEAIDFLFKKRCKLIIVACNTATSRALRKIQQEILPKKYPDKKILGVVIPALEEINDIISKKRKGEVKRVGVIGTRSTISSDVYKKELKRVNKKIKIFQVATPLLVPFIENNWKRRKETKTVLKEYLKPLKKEKIDILVLGCTHYPLLLNIIKKEIGKSVFIVDSSRATANKLQDYLIRHPEIEKKLSKNKRVKYYTTDDPKAFKLFAEDIMEPKLRNVGKAIL